MLWTGMPHEEQFCARERPYTEVYRTHACMTRFGGEKGSGVMPMLPVGNPVTPVLLAASVPVSARFSRLLKLTILLILGGLTLVGCVSTRDRGQGADTPVAP